MASEDITTAAAPSTSSGHPMENRRRSIFELSGDFFDSCRLISPGILVPSASQSAASSPYSTKQTLISNKVDEVNSRWTCNTCKEEFDSLVDQRSHFKSDFHRFNVKLSLAGKNIMKEEDFDKLTSDSFSKDFDVSSISGSEDEDEKGSHVGNSINEALVHDIRRKIFVRLLSGEKVSLWKCLLLKDSQSISYENDQFLVIDDNESMPCLREGDVIEKLQALIHEPRDGKHLRVILLAHGGHFAGCVFDGNTVVAHKTFHRYVVRAKAGKRQSSKDASGKSVHSAGALLRRYNELAMKKDIQEFLVSWKHYFDASICVFIHAPSSNRQLFYNGDKPLFSDQYCDARNIPFIVRRPTFKEARRIFGLLSQVSFEVDEDEIPDIKQLELNDNDLSKCNPVTDGMVDEVKVFKEAETCGSVKKSDEQSVSGESDEDVVPLTTPLHEAARCNNAEKVLEFLEQGLDPTIKDERGKTPYMLASEKEVRNTFRRFMAANLDKWDWHAANVPSALTKEMEETQAAKQAEKDTKRKAKAKELKKLRRAREKKAQAEAEESKNVTTAPQNKSLASSSVAKPIRSGIAARLSKEEELKRKQDEEREKRAAAAERRMALAGAAVATQGSSSSASSSTLQTKSGVGTNILCSCCNASLAGKVPFHRYNYKYCSTTCMRVHKEFLEDG